VYNMYCKKICSISVIVGLKFLLCGTYAFIKIQGVDFYHPGHSAASVG